MKLVHKKITLVHTYEKNTYSFVIIYKIFKIHFNKLQYLQVQRTHRFYFFFQDFFGFKVKEVFHFHSCPHQCNHLFHKSTCKLLVMRRILPIHQKLLNRCDVSKTQSICF